MDAPELPAKLKRKVKISTLGTIRGGVTERAVKSIAIELWTEIARLRRTLSLIHEDFAEKRDRDLDTAIEDIQDCRLISGSSLKQSMDKWG